MQLDDAYANAAHIPGGNDYFARWEAAASAFRTAMTGGATLDLRYGSSARERFDLFHPTGVARGLVVFIHGGFWLMPGKSLYSHLAAGAVAQGWAVAIPSYTLSPKARITQITRQIVTAIGAASDQVPGPIRITGHSAGGHLAARMACDDLDLPWLDRVARVMPISPLSDLAPLRMTSMNDDLRIDAAEAAAESPISHGQNGAPVTIWVGGAERPAFLDQARWLAQHWRCDHVIEPNRHHFDVIEGLAKPDSPILAALLA